MPSRISLLLTLLLALPALGRTADRATDSSQGLQAWTAFAGPDVAALNGSGVSLKSNPAQSFPRGLSAQAIYLVNTSVASAAAVFKAFDPCRHSELEVYQQRTFHAADEAEFSSFKIEAKAAPFQRLLAEMAAPKNLQLSPEERARLPRQKGVAAAQDFWAALLKDRWTQFAQDGKITPAGDFESRSEVRSLLQEEPKIAAHFAALFQPWTNRGVGNSASVHYWDASNTEGLANLELGAIFERMEGERRQLVDVTYYSSSGYIAAVSLFEFIPITSGATPQTLVWHGAMLSSADVAGGFGLRRKFGIRALEREMRQWIDLYRRECAAAK